MTPCRRELTVTPESIAGDEIQTVVAVVQQELAGFYTLEDLAGTRIEPGALFVKPKYIGQGIGLSNSLDTAMTLNNNNQEIF